MTETNYRGQVKFDSNVNMVDPEQKLGSPAAAAVVTVTVEVERNPET